VAALVGPGSFAWIYIGLNDMYAHCYLLSYTQAQCVGVAQKNLGDQVLMYGFEGNPWCSL
jgi:hypothetical protein